MGAHTCQYGTVHKICRCMKQHFIHCPTPQQCQAERAQDYQPKHKKEDVCDD